MIYSEIYFIHYFVKDKYQHITLFDAVTWFCCRIDNPNSYMIADITLSGSLLKIYLNTTSVSPHKQTGKTGYSSKLTKYNNPKDMYNASMKWFLSSWEENYDYYGEEKKVSDATEAERQIQEANEQKMFKALEEKRRIEIELRAEKEKARLEAIETELQIEEALREGEKWFSKILYPISLFIKK